LDSDVATEILIKFDQSKNEHVEIKLMATVGRIIKYYGETLGVKDGKKETSSEFKK
jgi:hypothetical protein